MKYYIEAYMYNDQRMLGNLDGQGVIVAQDFRRTKQYKALSTRKTINNSVAYYKIVSGETTFDTVHNTTFVLSEHQRDDLAKKLGQDDAKDDIDWLKDRLVYWQSEFDSLQHTLSEVREQILGINRLITYLNS